MPKVKANGITVNYDQQGSGEALILIPYLHAPMYEKVEEFNQRTLAFMQRHVS